MKAFVLAFVFNNTQASLNLKVFIDIVD